MMDATAIINEEPALLEADDIVCRCICLNCMCTNKEPEISTGDQQSISSSIRKLFSCFR